ncbi:sigma factor binding protein 1, chloroplastic-like [Coffea eugenioides]|uniref:sigma factor binding protein 1, chloroplastic-like n=1 Tax=Coffea eugenioides TaxID=49369 RepID=UPI000F613E13|nr:sigma factor binding protein 1, chloroplastic-like [Coffea eugenioides]
MDKMLSVNQKKTNKQPKNKKKPVKVVYISNPMKVKTSASEFRALVQELTGQDADMPDPTKYSDTDSVGGSCQEEVSTELKTMEDDHVVQQPLVQPKNEMPKRADCNIYGTCDREDDDLLFMPEGFPGLVASNLWYGASIHGDELKSLF